MILSNIIYLVVYFLLVAGCNWGYELDGNKCYMWNRRLEWIGDSVSNVMGLSVNARESESLGHEKICSTESSWSGS